MHFSALVTLAIATLAVATPTRRNQPASSCSTGDLQCCQSTQKATDPTAAAILKSIGVVVQGADVLVGLTCSPISVIGVGTSSCSANAVCCQDNSHGTLISIGCVPVTL